MMRKLVLELKLGEVAKKYVGVPEWLLEKVELLESIHNQISSNNRFTGLWRIRLKDHRLKVRDLAGVAGLIKVKIVSKEKEGYVIYTESRPRKIGTRGQVSGIYVCFPMEFDGERIRVTLLGDPSRMRRVLGWLHKSGLSYKIASVGDARFGRISLFSMLTEKQKRAMIAAYEKGYYDVPRRIGAKEIAQILKVSPSTLVEHLRRAEKHLLDQLVPQ